LNINSDNNSIADSDSSSNSESDSDDETMENNELDNNPFKLDDEDRDVTIIQNVDELVGKKENMEQNS
ncbi:unnamed protein product, partial [Rotaria sp. Silwood1]